MKCPKCSSEVISEWKVCPYCQFIPKRCGNTECEPRWLPLEARFSPQCGRALNGNMSSIKTIEQRETVAEIVKKKELSRLVGSLLNTLQ